MTIYKAKRSLVHRLSGESLAEGAFCSDEGTYNTDDGTQTIATGEAVVNVRQAPPPILWRPSFFAGRSQKDINLLIGTVLDIVDESHEDYARLVEFGVIKTKKTKPVKEVITLDEGTK